MELSLNAHEILHQESVLREDFNNNLLNWEITSEKNESAFIKDGFYWMENKTEHKWTYYKQPMPLRSKADFIIDTVIELVGSEAYGHAGIVWGFDDERIFLNRFTVSADGERCTIIHFHKDHHFTKHRFQLRKSNGFDRKPVRLSVAKIESNYYFFVNDIQVYTCNTAHLGYYGNNFGYYVEPELFIRSPYIEIHRLIAKPVEKTPLKELIN